MEFTLPLPKQLDRDGVLIRQWTHFFQRFHSRQSNLSFDHSSEAESILLFSAQHHLNSIFESLRKYNLDAFKLSKILEAVEQVCLPYFLLLFERFRYFTLEQDTSDTMSDFVNVMRKQIDLCEFGDTKDSIMTNTKVSGVGGENIRQNLQDIGKLCFNDVVNLQLSNKNVAPDNVATLVSSSSANNISVAISKRKLETKRKDKKMSRPKPAGTMYIVPLNTGIKDEFEDDHAVTEDDHAVKAVVNPRVKTYKLNLKKTALLTKTISFLCFGCDSKYTSRKSFRRHITSKHADCTEYYCKHCDSIFHSRSECITHCLGHKTVPYSGVNRSESKVLDNTEYICWYCEEKVPNLDDYKKHCSTHSAIRVFYCDLCQRKNHTLPRMIGHLKGHLSARYRCDICANCFGRAELLAAHLETHAAQPVHQCQVCSKNFVSADRLQGHMRTHSGEKRFTCELCGKSFCQKMSLDYHKRVHAGEKPYECDICGKRTASFGYLRKHKQMHSDKRPYVCEVCGKSFRFISNLNRHRNGHSGKRAFGCDVCGRTFIYREGLRDHIKAGRCPGRKQDGITKRSARAPRAKNQQAHLSALGSGQVLASYTTSQHTAENLLNDLPHWQYMLRNNEPDGSNSLVVVPPYY